MKNLFMKRSFVLFLQTVVVLIGISALAFLLWEPQIEGVNANATNFEIYFKDPFLAFVYVGSIAFFIALYEIFKLIGYAGQNTFYSEETVKAFRKIKYCAIKIIGFVIVAEIFIMSNTSDDRAGGVMIGLVIIFISTIVAIVATMLERKVNYRLSPSKS